MAAPLPRRYDCVCTARRLPHWSAQLNMQNCQREVPVRPSRRTASQCQSVPYLTEHVIAVPRLSSSGIGETKQSGRPGDANATWVRRRVQSERYRSGRRPQNSSSHRRRPWCVYHWRDRLGLLDRQWRSAPDAWVGANRVTKHGAGGIARISRQPPSPSEGVEGRDPGAPRGPAAPDGSGHYRHRGQSEIWQQCIVRILVLGPGCAVVRNRKPTGSVGRRAASTTAGKSASSIALKRP